MSPLFALGEDIVKEIDPVLVKPEFDSNDKNAIIKDSLFFHRKVS